MSEGREFAVIGLGRFGKNVVRTLCNLGHQVLAIDQKDARVQAIAPLATEAVQADATDVEALSTMALGSFHTVVVAIGNDLEDSVLVTLALKELGVNCVIAKASSERHGKILSSIGADRVIFPERDMAVRLAKTLSSENVLDLIEITPDISIEELTAQGAIVGKSLRELDLRARFGVTVMAIRRGNQVFVSPSPDEQVKAGDTLVAIGTNHDLEQFEKLSF